MQKNKLSNFLYRIDEYLAALCGLSLVFVTLLGIFMRYASNNPLKWTEEVSLGVFVWYIMLGSGSTIKNNMNVTIDFVVDLFPKKVQRVVEIFVYILTYAVMITLFVIGCSFCERTSVKITPVLRLPYTVIAVAIPVGFGLMLIHQSLNLVNQWKKHKKEKEENL